MTNQELIDTLKSYGFGWKKFANSVESQGFVTNNQRDTMILMLQKAQRIQRNRSRIKDSPEQDLSDSEAMSFGVHF